MSAYFAGPQIVFPTGAHQVTSDDAFNWKHVRLPYQHGSTLQLWCLLHSSRHLLLFDGDEVIWDDVRELLKPKLRK